MQTTLAGRCRHMLAQLTHRARRRPVVAGLWFSCGLLVVWALVANIVGYAGFLMFRAELDSARFVVPSGETVTVSWTFPFADGRSQIDLEVDQAELRAEGGIPTNGIFGSRGWLRRLYVREVVAWQSDSAVIDRLAAEFRRIRDQRALGDDEYLELMVTGVQAIPYGDTEIETMLAAETLACGSGICTDKSLLLASLLVHEGYETVLWVFPTQRHVAVGVASSRARFQGTQYAFIETTGSAFVGQAEPKYLAAGPVARPPAEIALGGERRYGAGDQVEAILAELRRQQVISSSVVTYAQYARSDGTYRRRYAERAREYLVASTTATFILTNTHDRRGVYSLVSALAPGDSSAPQMPAR